MSGTFNDAIDKTKSIDGDDLRTLLISIVSLVILLYFITKIGSGIYTALREYFDDIRQLEGEEVMKRKDEYRYSGDLDDTRNYNHQIQERLRQIKKSNESEFQKLTDYKKKHDLDSTLYAQVNTKTVSGGHDNYEYVNAPTVIDFINSLFKPA